MRSPGSLFALLLAGLLTLGTGCSSSDTGGGTTPNPDFGTESDAKDATGDPGPGDVASDPGVDAPRVDPGADEAPLDKGPADPGSSDPGAEDVADAVEDTSADGADGGEDLSCTIVAECAGKVTPGLCQVARCNAGTCDLGPDASCCAGVADCDDGNPCTDEACTQGKCIYTPVESQQCCQAAKTLFHADFDDGTLGAFTVLDQNKNDKVTWAPSKRRSHSGKYSLYLGDPDCHTYFNGGLDENCVAAAGGASASRVLLSLSSPPVALPEKTLIAGSMWIFIATEGPLGLPNLPEPDAVRVRVNTFDGSAEVFSSVSIDKTTGGALAFVLFDLSPFAGKSVELEILFDTFDGSDNNFEGIYLDDLEIFTYCGSGLCSGTGTCADDGDVCTDDTCVGFSNSALDLCAYPKPKGDCVGCKTVGDCDDEDPCTTESCSEGGICSFVQVVSEACCTPSVESTTDFESTLSGWDGLGDGSQVGWKVTANRGKGGGSSLHFGRELSPGIYSYENGTEVSEGTVTSAPIQVPDQTAMLTFDLFLSTEWDLGGELIAGFDRFSVGIMGEVTPLWDSDAIGGSTGDAFVPVSVDLSPWAGKTIRLTFTFSSGDGSNNDFEGPFVDDLSIVAACNPPACNVSADCEAAIPCIETTCTQGVCEEGLAKPGCCTKSQDCNDDESCTKDTCANNTCVYTPVLGSTCCVDIAWFSDSFESSDGGYTVGVEDGDGFNADAAWQRRKAVAQAPDGNWAFYFGDGTTQTLGGAGTGIAQGTLTSPAFAVPSQGTAMLEFDLVLDTRWKEIDEATSLPIGLLSFPEARHASYLSPSSAAGDLVVFFPDGGSTFKEELLYLRVIEPDAAGGEPTITDLWYSGYIFGYTDGSERVRVDLSAWKGKTIQVQWFFSTYFEPAFEHTGVLLDRIVFSSVCDATDCVGPQDCAFDNDPCTHNTCEAFTCGTKPGPGQGCCVPTAIFSADFEGADLAALGFIVNDGTPGDDVTWQLDGTQAHSGAKAAYYGNPATLTYASAPDDNRAELVTPPVQLPSGSSLELTFWIFQDVEVFTEDWENFHVELFPADDAAAQPTVILDTFFDQGPQANLDQVKPDAVPELTWHKITLVGFDNLAGLKVRVRILFDTIDPQLNDTLGIFIDDLQVQTTCAQ